MGLLADIQMFKRARMEGQEAQAQADWNALGRASAALEVMRREGMDENLVRLAEKRLFMDPNSKVSQAWRRVTGLSPMDAFQVDTLYAEGQAQYPKFVGWGQMPKDKLEQATATARLEAGEPQATAQAQTEQARYGAELFGAKRGVLAKGGVRGEALMGLPGPQLYTGPSGAYEYQPGQGMTEVTPPGMATERGLRRGYEASEEKRKAGAYTSNQQYKQVQMRYLEALIAQAETPQVRAEIKQFNKMLKDAYDIGIGGVIPFTDKDAENITAAFTAVGLQKAGYKLILEPVRDDPFLGVIPTDVGDADYMRVRVVPEGHPYQGSDILQGQRSPGAKAPVPTEGTGKAMPSPSVEDWMSKIPVK